MKNFLSEIIAVGHLKNVHLASECTEFIKRLTPVAKLEITELKDSTVVKEGLAILKHLEVSPNAFVVALGEEGQELSSQEFASFLNNIERKIVFIIGGPFGLSPEVKQRADKLISLSRMTFTHEMARMLLLEQFYRATSILAGKNYHHN